MLDTGICSNLSIWKAEAGGLLLVQGQRGLCRESVSYKQTESQG